MAIIGDLVTRISADSKPFNRGITSAQSSLGSFSSSIASFGGMLRGAVIGGVAAAGAGIAGLGYKAISAAAQMERARISLEVFSGSAEMADTIIGQLKGFAASTPFQFDGLAESAKTLMGFGIESENVVATLQTISNVAAGDSNKLKSISLVYGQIASAGRLMGQDLLQLINVGFNPLQVISEKTGESMLELKKRMEDGKISFAEVQQAFISATSEGGRFYQMNEKQSQTVLGLWSTFKDNFSNIMISLGERLTTALNIKGVLSNMITGLQNAVTIGEWASQNLGGLFELAIAKIKLGFVSWWADLGHLFGVQIPTLASWAADNFTNIWQTSAANMLTIFENLGENLKSIWKSVWTFISSGGTKALAIDWTPLTDGLVNTIGELPEIPAREMNALEKTLKADMDRIQGGLSASFNQFKDEKAAEMQKALATPELKVDATNPDVNTGEGIKEGVAAGSLAGSKEAFDTILASQMAGAREKDKTEAELKKQTTVLQTIARELARPKPDDVIFGGAF